MKSSAILLFASLVVGTWTGSAFAQSSPREHYDKGMIFYNIQDWPSAIRELKAAYEGDPRPDYLYALAQAERLSGDCASAILTYRAFGRQATGAPAAAAEGFIHVCEEKQKEKETAALAAAAAAAAPPPASAVTTGHAAPAPPQKPTEWYADPLGDTLAIVGIGGLVTGAIFMAEYGSNRSAAGSAGTDSASQADWSKAQPQIVVGSIGLGVGAVALAAAIWRYTAVNAKARATPSVGFWVQPGGAQLSYGTQF
jgi:hypothetical protein